MRLIGLRCQFNGAAGLASPPVAEPSNCEARRRDVLGRWRKDRNAGLTAVQSADAIDIPVSTLYRRAKRPTPKSRVPHTLGKRTWKHKTIREVERLHREHPVWGKAKIGPILREAGHDLSDSTVGRILGYPVKHGAVQLVPTARCAARRRKGVEGRYARRWTGDLKADRPRNPVQFDILTVRSSPGRTVKQFTACDPKAHFTVAQAFTGATGRAAGRFLGKVADALPFSVRAI